MLCAFHGYRFGGDEDAGRHARHKDRGGGQKGTGGQILDDASLSGGPGSSSEAPRGRVRLFTLTDNLPEVQTRQLEHGGIADFFERRFSADGVKHHKPSPQAYGYVARELRVEPSELCLIACHTWDTLGAVAAGWKAALIKRVGKDLLGVGPQPQIVGANLHDVADQLIAQHRERTNVA